MKPSVGVRKRVAPNAGYMAYLEVRQQSRHKTVHLRPGFETNSFGHHHPSNNKNNKNNKSKSKSKKKKLFSNKVRMGLRPLWGLTQPCWTFKLLTLFGSGASRCKDIGAGANRMFVWRLWGSSMLEHKQLHVLLRRHPPKPAIHRAAPELN